MVIICDIGINHQGNIYLAHEMIRQAKICGADIAKFQFYDPEKLFGVKGTHPNSELCEFTKTVQFDNKQAQQLKKWCDEENIEFMASVFDLERFEWMEKIGMERYKIASRSVENTELCTKILNTDKETFVSLGFWNNSEVPYKHKNARYLYCVSKYPCEYKDIEFPMKFKNSIYEGFSDHTMGIGASLMAISKGAKVIEKHFTLNKGLSGPDHVCSIIPEELKDLTKYAREIEKYESN
jgi:sialic acid synthase SpsE